MSKVSLKQPVIASILDRLIDEVPEKTEEPLRSHNQLLYELRSSVKRDLENLLNTRRRYVSWDKAWEELDKSLVDYGIPDFMGTQLDSKNVQKNFCCHLEQIIRRYEPRFKEIKVKLQDYLDKRDGTLHIRIEGLLYAEPVPEPIIFDSTLEPETRNFQVESIA